MSRTIATHSASTRAINSVVQFFDLPPTDVTIQTSRWVQEQPLTPTGNQFPVIFVINPQTGFVDLSRSKSVKRITLSS